MVSVCYGPNGEEFELAGKRRSGSFIEKIKGRTSMSERSLNVNLVGISNLFNRAAKTNLPEEEQYAEVNKVDENEVRGYFKTSENVNNENLAKTPSNGKSSNFDVLGEIKPKSALGGNFHSDFPSLTYDLRALIKCPGTTKDLNRHKIHFWAKTKPGTQQGVLLSSRD